LGIEKQIVMEMRYCQDIGDVGEVGGRKWRFPTCGNTVTTLSASESTAYQNAESALPNVRIEWLELIANARKI
jgi:hypothetical protein